MTANQIKFAEHRENVRHNQEMESQGRATISETGRHNLVQEGIGQSNVGLGYANLGELSRHNQAQEAVNWFTAENLAYLQGSQSDYYQTLGSKVASEVGVERSKLVQSGISTLYTNLLNQQRLGEDVRHNTASESEIARSNRASEDIRRKQVSETKRHNKATEHVDKYNAMTQRRRANAQQTEALIRVLPIIGRAVGGVQ